MSPSRDYTPNRSSLFRRIDENTPVSIKLSVLIGVLLFAVSSTWWASEVKNAFNDRINADKAESAAAIAALKAKNEAQEEHLHATDMNVQELRHGIDRIESKVDDVNRYLRSSSKP